MWWRATSGALARTALAALVPFVAALVTDPAGAWLPAASIVSMATVLAAVTALAGMPDPDGLSWAELAGARALRTFGQTVAAAAGAAVMLSDVAWSEVLPVALGAALTSLVLAAVQALPSFDANDPSQLHIKLVPDVDSIADAMVKASVKAVPDPEYPTPGSI
jgi:hypothetical protein